MSRNRAVALLTSVAASLALAVGSLAVSATAAQAAPGPYPAVPPTMTVNKAVVKYPVAIKATGRKYHAGERVTVTISYKRKGTSKYKTVKTSSVRADGKGKFLYYLLTFGPGIVKVTGTGTFSKKSASASIFVIDKKKKLTPWKPVSLQAPVEQRNNGAWLAAAGIGVLALAGSAAVTRRTIRRRK